MGNSCLPGRPVATNAKWQKAGRGENMHLPLQAEKMVVLCLSAVPFPLSLSSHLTPCAHTHPHPSTSICHHYVPLPPTVGLWLWCPWGQRLRDGGAAGRGGSLLLKRLKQSIASHQPPQGPLRALTTLTLVEMFSSMEEEGKGERGSLLGVNEEGGGSHWGRSISLEQGWMEGKWTACQQLLMCEMFSCIFPVREM